MWSPVYGRYSRDITERRLQDLEAHGLRTAELRKTRQLVQRYFDDYFGVTKTKKYGFAFAIPTRVNRRAGNFNDEVRIFLPIMDQLDEKAAQVFMSEMPPTILDEYCDKSGKTIGAIIFMPIFADMLYDIRPKLWAKMRVNKIVKDSAIFARDKLGAEIIGLGAMLPKLTRFGKDVAKHGIVATTGHAGTVYLIHQEFKAIIDGGYIRPKSAMNVGIIGAGSISSSTATMILASHPDTTISVYDIRKKVLKGVVEQLNHRYPHRARAASSNDDILRSADIIISAVTSRITVGDDIDLRGKIIIDDSQPGSFSQQEVKRHGGTLVWVVGHDNSSSRFLTRHSKFRFGDEGLVSAGDVWGCEAEVAALWRAGRIDLAVQEQVTPEIVQRVGAILEDAGIGYAQWQASGKHVTLHKAKT